MLDLNAMTLEKVCLGTWSLGGEHFGPFDCKEVKPLLLEALDYGIRDIDTALFYAHGRSVQFLGKYLKKELYMLDRHSVFIVKVD